MKHFHMDIIVGICILQRLPLFINIIIRILIHIIVYIYHHYMQLPRSKIINELFLFIYYFNYFVINLPLFYEELFI